jgi:hypothetical protein
MRECEFGSAERPKEYRVRCDGFAGAFRAVLQASYARFARMDKRKDETTP